MNGWFSYLHNKMIKTLNYINAGALDKFSVIILHVHVHAYVFLVTLTFTLYHTSEDQDIS